MTEPELPMWAGVYGVDKAAREAPGGYDAADDVIRRQVRESAIAADHTPVGAVQIMWLEPASVVVDGEPVVVDPSVDPSKVYARAAVRVRPNTVRKDRIAAGIESGALAFQVVSPDDQTLVDPGR